MKISHIVFICFPLFLFSQTEKKPLNKIDSINNNIVKAHVLNRNYKYQEAIELITSSIIEATKIKNDSLIGKAHISLGLIYTNLGKTDLAIKEQKKALEFSKKKNSSKRIQAFAYNNIGHTFYENLKETDSAIYYFKKAIKIYKNLNEIKYLDLSYYNLGEMYEKSDQLDLALKTLDSAVYYSKKSNYTYALSFSYQELSTVYIKKKDTINSLKYINHSLNIAEKEKYNDILKKLYGLKYKILRKQNNTDKALENLEKYQIINELIYENNLSKITQEIAAKYELKQTENLLNNAITEGEKNKKNLKASRVVILLVFILLFISLLLAYSLFKNNKLKKENNKLLVSKNNKLKELQHKTELEFLKNQIQPHFFFNTLNNLYALIIDKSDKAQDVVVKLSELMQYVIYESKKAEVSIWDEITNIQNYLELESLRYEKLNVNSLNIDGNIDEIKVPPLLFTTFVENSFKHGNVYNEDFKLDINIKRLDSGNITFCVKNSFKENSGKSKGIGLQNIKRQLDLIYKDNYKLDIIIENNIFWISLKIPVKDNN